MTDTPQLAKELLVLHLNRQRDVIRRSSLTEEKKRRVRERLNELITTTTKTEGSHLERWLKNIHELLRDPQREEDAFLFHPTAETGGENSERARLNSLEMKQERDDLEGADLFNGGHDRETGRFDQERNKILASLATPNSNEADKILRTTRQLLEKVEDNACRSGTFVVLPRDDRLRDFIASFDPVERGELVSYIIATTQLINARWNVDVESLTAPEHKNMLLWLTRHSEVTSLHSILMSCDPDRQVYPNPSQNSIRIARVRNINWKDWCLHFRDERGHLHRMEGIDQKNAHTPDTTIYWNMEREMSGKKRQNKIMDLFEVKLVSTRGEWLCRKCGALSPSAEDLELHVLSVHLPFMRYYCPGPFCDKTSLTRQDIIKHGLSDHVSSGEQRTKETTETASPHHTTSSPQENIRKDTSHQDEYNLAADMELPCPLCPRIGLRTGEHFRRQHLEGKGGRREEWQSKLCAGKTISTRSKLRHIAEVHLKKTCKDLQEKRYETCHLCNLRVLHKNLTRHLHSLHLRKSTRDTIPS